MRETQVLKKVSDKPGLYEYATAFSMLFLGTIVTIFTLAGIIGLFQSGFGVFFGVVGGVIVFCGITHEIAKVLKRNDWL